MENRKGLTLVEVIVVILVIAVLLSAVFAVMRRWRHKNSPVCWNNLHMLGTAMTVYANDYDGAYPQLPGKGAWSKRLGFDYDMKEPDFGLGGAQEYRSRTITASWYLLAREADVYARSFLCPKSLQEEFDGANPGNRDITELWDFGHDPYKHVSYSMHNPYGTYPADATKGAEFAVAADMSPWFLDGDIVAPGTNGEGPQLIADDWSINAQVEKTQIQAANSSYHDHEGQNVLYGDGHSSYEKRSDVGVKHDGIYTYQSGGDIRIGKNPTSRDEVNDARSEDDSFLGI